ncbi:TetR/AcrR family transcriptional regulator [Halorhabdus amylolytica]|uniref:TetR/AcrR family transcriptional regulator n=1 Tax=Halorhabdus amylolytica TaxID=2559573 RepID=UPI0020C0FBCE|nr:TetR/AcrR family transcriptional regulator [Halorhabdus amylolytica]
MIATFQALCKHGYAGTSISRIAEEFPKSKSLLYYHYEDKEELLSDFLAHLLDQFESELEADGDEPPIERLETLLDLLAPENPAEERVQLLQAMMEMQAQAPHKPAYREQFRRTNELITTALVDVIEDGIADGTFRDVDAQRVAEFVLASLYGTLDRSVLVEDPDSIGSLRDELDRYIAEMLLADD